MIGKLHTVVLDTPDIKGLSKFYRELSGLSEHHEDEYWITLQTPAGHRLAFQRADDHVAPRWPDPKHPQQMHLDFQVPDLEAAVTRAEELGATRLPGGGESWTVLADPSGHSFCLCKNDEVTTISLYDVALDCPDGTALANFYAQVLGYEVTYSGAEGAMITAVAQAEQEAAAEGQLPIMFQNVAEYHPPQWPDPAFPQQFHLDILVTDVEEAEPKVLALGAVKIGDGDGDWRVYKDPARHPFCLVW